MPFYFFPQELPPGCGPPCPSLEEIFGWEVDEEELRTARDGSEHLQTSEASRRLTALSSAAPKELASHVQVRVFVSSTGVDWMYVAACWGDSSVRPKAFGRLACVCFVCGVGLVCAFVHCKCVDFFFFWSPWCFRCPERLIVVYCAAKLCLRIGPLLCVHRGGCHGASYAPWRHAVREVADVLHVCTLLSTFRAIEVVGPG